MKVRLGDVCNFEKGTTGIQKAKPGEYPLVVTGPERKTCNTYQFDCEAVCIPLVSSTGHGHKSLNYIHFQSGKFALGTILVAVVPKNKSTLNAEYLREYLFNFKDDLLVPLMRGGANVTLSINNIQNVELEIPNIEKQESIVKNIKAAKEQISIIIDNLNLNQLQISQLRKSLFQTAVSGSLTKEDTHIESAEVLLEKISLIKEKLTKEGKLKRDKALFSISSDEYPFKLPKGWKWSRLGYITNYGYTTKIKPSDITSKTWILELEDIEKESSKLNNKVLSNERKSNSDKNEFHKGDVLYGKLRPYLDKVIIADDNGACSTEIIPIKSYGNIIMNSYLKLYLKSPLFLSYAKSKVYGMKMPRLGTEDARKALIPIPPLNEQKNVVEKIESLMKVCDFQLKIIETAKDNVHKLAQSIFLKHLEVN